MGNDSEADARAARAALWAHIEAQSDAVAELLGVDPEKVMASREGISLTVSQADALIELARRGHESIRWLKGGEAQAPSGLQLKQLRIEYGQVEAAVVAPEEVVKALGAGLVHALNGAPNYAEAALDVAGEDGQRYVLTVRRLIGKTPHQMKVEAETERDQLREEVSRLRALLSAAQLEAFQNAYDADEAQARLAAGGDL